LLAADTTPGGYRLTTDIEAARDPALQIMLGAPQRAALTDGPPRAPPQRSTHPDPRHTRSLEGGTYSHVSAGGARRAPALPQSARPSFPRPPGPSRPSGRPPITADCDGASCTRYISSVAPARQGGRSASQRGNAAVRSGRGARLRRAAARVAAWAHQVAPAGGRTGNAGRCGLPP
jgi:hypothetical protein